MLKQKNLYNSFCISTTSVFLEFLKSSFKFNENTVFCFKSNNFSKSILLNFQLDEITMQIIPLYTRKRDYKVLYGFINLNEVL